MTGNFINDTVPKPIAKNVVRLNNDQLDKIKADKSIFYRSLNRSLQEESIFIQGASLDDKSVKISVASSKFKSIPRLVGRSARILSALTPNEVEEIIVHTMNGDIETAIFKIDRNEFDKGAENVVSVNEILNKTKVTSNSSDPLLKRSEFKPKINFPEFSWTMAPALKHQIGGPEGFYLGQLWWRTDTSIKFSRNFSLYTTFGLDIYNNFDSFNNASTSSLPHVRSDIQDYLSEGRNNIQRMKLEYMISPYKDWFIRADLGLMEEMFGAVGGEILYRPFNKRYNLGLTLHKVKQRGFKQRLSFRKYEALTGHLSLYYDFPKGISGQFMAGKYLAGDKGATVDLSRRFSTGFTLGVFATKTNVSAEEFGEGSFDKGFYFSIPTELFYSDHRTGNITFGMHPLTKDGGALLNQHNSLFSILGDSNRASVIRDWQDFLN